MRGTVIPMPERDATTAESLEIERKFLLSERPEWLDDHPSAHIYQGYVAIVPGEVEVRVRETDGDPTLTVKRGEGEVRREEEIELTSDQFRALWPLTEDARLEKRRYSVPHEGLTVEVDVYEGFLDGLIVAEVEFDAEDDSAKFEAPEWFGDEVTGNPGYANESLATRGEPE
jgi:adenylate cyclase